MSYCNNYEQIHSRREFLRKTGLGLGAAALGTLINPMDAVARGINTQSTDPTQGILSSPHFAPKAKRVIYLFQSGGPSQIELFDYKPELYKYHGKEIPPSVMGDGRISGMVSNQASFPLVGSCYDFRQYGQSGAWISELMPYTAEIADELCFIKSMHTDAINHEPAVIMFQTGHQQSGRPSIGAWLSYGLGSDNENLPAFVVLISKGGGAQPLNSSAWSNGFLPAHHQGVQFRAGKEPVLYLNNPEGRTKDDRARTLNDIEQLNLEQPQIWGDPGITSKIAQYEMAFRMQSSVPDVVDLSGEPDYIYEMYGEDSRIPGTFAANCLLARRLAEQHVKFIQLYHMGWDQHGGLPRGIRNMANTTDQASAALIKDLKQRGLLEDTLVIWGGEFGRTSFSQGRLTEDNYGRDHHARCFSLWMAGAGVKRGLSYGQTDDFSFNIVENPVHVHDFQATLLHLLGIDHERLTFKHQGRRYRLTDVHGHVVKPVLA